MILSFLRILTGLILLYPIYYQIRGFLRHGFNNGEMSITRLVIFHVTMSLFIANGISLYIVYLLESGREGVFFKQQPLLSLGNAISLLLASGALAWLYYKLHQED